MNVTPDIVELKGTSRELAASLLTTLAPRSHVLYPCAARTTGTLEDHLHPAGHDLQRLICYATEPIPAGDRGRIDWDRIDAAVVAAPSAVDVLSLEPNLPSRMVFAAIGPTTERSLREHGFRVLGVAATPGTAGIVKLLTDECPALRRRS